MAIKVHNPLPNLDYAPVTGEHDDISFGIVESVTRDGKLRRLEDVVARRLYPTERPTSGLPLEAITAERWEVLLPAGAADELIEPEKLCAAYHVKKGAQIQHLAGVVSIRFPGADQRPPTMRLHECWELGRSFGRYISSTLEVAVVAVLHVPGRSWGLGPPHIHLVCPSRVVRPATGFSAFVRELTDPVQGRAFVDAGWTAVLHSQITSSGPSVAELIKARTVPERRDRRWYADQLKRAATEYARLFVNDEGDPRLPGLMLELQWCGLQLSRLAGGVPT